MLHWHFYFGESKGGNHKGFPLEFSPFGNPLSLTPVESQVLSAKSWYCQELKKLSDTDSKNPDCLTTPILRALDRKQKSDKTHPRGTHPGGDKEKGFQKGRTLRGGRQPPSCGSPLLSQRLCRCSERSQRSIEARL